jgi:hypothetical protein
MTTCFNNKTLTIRTVFSSNAMIFENYEEALAQNVSKDLELMEQLPVLVLNLGYEFNVRKSN